MEANPDKTLTLILNQVWKRIAEINLRECAKLSHIKGKIFKFQKQFSNHLSKVEKIRKNSIWYFKRFLCILIKKTANLSQIFCQNKTIFYKHLNRNKFSNTISSLFNNLFINFRKNWSFNFIAKLFPSEKWYRRQKRREPKFRSGIFHLIKLWLFS